MDGYGLSSGEDPLSVQTRTRTILPVGGVRGREDRPSYTPPLLFVHFFIESPVYPMLLIIVLIVLIVFVVVFVVFVVLVVFVVFVVFFTSFAISTTFTFFVIILDWRKTVWRMWAP